MRKYDLTPPPGAPTSPAAADPEGTTTDPGASNAQLKFLRGLCDEREIDDAARESLLTRVAVQQELNDKHGDCAPPLAVAGLTKRRASEFIGRLLEKPKRLRRSNSDPARDIIGEHHPRYTPPGPDDLPAGRYAVKNKDGQLRFYRVARGTRNKAMVWLHLEHGNDSTEIRFSSPEFRGIIGLIAEDPLKAARLYGRHRKTCSECGRGLTNRVSRLLDIGPVCGGHHCDPAIWEQMKATAREALRAAGLDPDQDVEDTDDLDRIREEAGL